MAALLRAATSTLPYLAVDASRSLASTAIWAIGGIPGKTAPVAREALASDSDDLLAHKATEQLQRRR